MTGRASYGAWPAADKQGSKHGQNTGSLKQSSRLPDPGIGIRYAYETSMSDFENEPDAEVFASPRLLNSVEDNGHFVALGLVAIGMIGAFVGAAQFGRQSHRLIQPTTPDSGNATPPHGDKLLRRR
jgi:hypothetical protein